MAGTSDTPTPVAPLRTEPPPAPDIKDAVLTPFVVEHNVGEGNAAVPVQTEILFSETPKNGVKWGSLQPPCYSRVLHVGFDISMLMKLPRCVALGRPRFGLACNNHVTRTLVGFIHALVSRLACAH